MRKIEKRIRRLGYSFDNWMDKQLTKGPRIIKFVKGMLLGVISILFVISILVSFPVLLELPFVAKRPDLLVVLLMTAIGFKYFSPLLFSGIILLMGFLGSIFFWSCIMADYKKLPEVVIPEAEEILEKEPELEKILIQNIAEAREGDDGDELRKLLDKIRDLTRLEYEQKRNAEGILRLKKELFKI